MKHKLTREEAVLQPHYSGERSKSFWSFVNRLCVVRGDLTLYRIGCYLQYVEGRALRELNDAAKKERKQ